MFSKFFIVFLFVNIFSHVSALVELPQVEENSILETDAIIRQTTNELFSLLKLKLNKDRPNLKQYSLIHNYLVSTSLQDYTNLKEIAKLTRVDKTRLNNETCNFMTHVNEILNEDIKHDTATEDEYVIRHIEGFLTNLDKFTEKYEYSENIDDLITEIVRILEKNNTFSDALKRTKDSDGSWLNSEEDDNLLDDNEFWVPNARRIFQGYKSNIKDFPFMASIQVLGQFQCAGSIIKSDLIISAASCLQLSWNNRFFRENPNFLTARVGSSFPNIGGEIIGVSEIYFHPDYDPKSLRNNLCILRLLRQLKFRKKKKTKIKKIEIDRKPNPLPVVIYGRQGIDITIVGWGAKGVSPTIKDQYVSFAVLDIYPIQECQGVYSPQFVTQKNFCAGFMSKGSGACTRDIGGPGIMNGVLMGVVSFGAAACGSPGAPTVFTKLGFYADWIDSVIDQNVVHGKKMTTLLQPKKINLPIYYTSPRTTFKVTPIVLYKKSRQSNVEMQQIEMLRELQEQGLLKQFVHTMIGSDEAQELLQEAEAVERVRTKQSNRPIFAPIRETKSFRDTVVNNSEIAMNIYSNSSTETIEVLSELETEKTKKKEKELEFQIEKDIMYIIDRMNDYVNDSKKAVERIENNYDDPENLLKLLYLSEMGENVSSVTADAGNQEPTDGIQIPLKIPTRPQPSQPRLEPQSSLDLSYRNNKSDTEIFLSKQDLIDLFSEALKEEIQVKTNATAGIIVKRSRSTIKQIPKTSQTKRDRLKMKSIYAGYY